MLEIDFIIPKIFFMETPVNILKKGIIAIAIIPCFIPTLTFAKIPGSLYPQPNQNGDYHSIQTTHQQGKNNPHLVWQVVASSLNCRVQPGTNQPIKRTFRRSDGISISGQPKVYKDKQGKPWLYVTQATSNNPEDFQNKCFIRANSQYIQPIPYDL